MNFRIRPSILVVALFSLVFVIGFFLLINPQLAPIGENLARLDAYSHLTIPTPAPAENTAALADQTAKVQGLLPQENQLYDLSVEIEALAHTLPISLTSLNLTPAVSGAPATTSAKATAGSGGLPSSVQKSSISISATGSYADLQTFAENLTKLQRYIDIQDLTMNGSAESTQSTVNITAITYNLPNASH